MKTQQEIVHFSSGKFMPYIFASYSHDDQEIVKLLLDKLMESGFCVWVDYNNLRGLHFADEIRNGIRECSIFLECLSKSYVTKPYCEKEFLFADDENKNVVAVCLDNVSKADNPNRFPVGGNAIGYGKGIMEDLDKYYEEVLQQAVMVALKDFMEKEEDAITMKYIFVDQKLSACLQNHCKNVYKNSGTYCLDKIHRELFPGIADHSKDRVYKAENAENVSLYEYIKNKDYTDRHILLKGNGGMGKTVSMLQTCEKLLQEGVCAVYVPLNKIRFSHGDSIGKYIQREICTNDPYIWNNLQACARADSGSDGKVFLFIDGVNELPLNDASELIQREIVEGLFLSNAWKGTRFVLSSRYELPQSEDAFDEVKVLEMLPLELEQMKEFLQKHEIRMPDNSKVQSLLSNPLMLSLYANAEVYRHLYEKRGQAYGIHLEKVPDTPGKIIRNFLQTQLFQMISIARKDYIVYYVLLEYALPYLAYEMVRNDSTATLKEVRNILKEACDVDRNVRFGWLEEDKLEDILWNTESASDFTKKDVKNLYKYAVDKYRFLYRTGQREEGEDDYVEFLHQDFRDYFAAYHVANEIKAIHRSPKRWEKENMILGEKRLPKELVEFCADILHEQEACPWEDEEGWHFPGKSGILPSRNSIVEQSLRLYKGQFDQGDNKEIQTAVMNLLGIMRKGRNGCLAYCDFSELDLRGCRMNGCHFAEFHKENIYGSKFDGAYIDRRFLLGSGHSDDIAALCLGRKNEIISGDISGVVNVWNYTNGKVKNILKQPDRVVDLAFDSKNNILAVACENQICLYDFLEEKVIASKINETGSQYFRYIQFGEDGEAEYAYDLHPFLWYKWSGTEPVKPIDFNVISGCAKFRENQKGVQFIYSEMYQKVNVVVLEKSAGDDKNVYRRRTVDIQKELECKKRVEAIQYSEDGSRFLIAIGRCVLEYETESLALLRRKHFREIVYDVRYGEQEGLIVAAEKDILVLDSKWSIIYSLKHENVEVIDAYRGFGEKYYIVSPDMTVKEMDSQLCVTRMRKCISRGKFAWVRDRRTDEIQMLFTKNGEEGGERFSFETGTSIPAGWCFEMLEAFGNAHRREYVMSNKVVSFDMTDISKKYEYQNHGGMWIFGCSFCDIKGTMSEAANLQLLKKNGGIIDADRR